MFAIQVVFIVSIMIFGGINWCSNGCFNKESNRRLQTFIFIENSTYSVNSPGDEFLFRAHFSNRLLFSEKQRAVIYFIDPLTFEATVLKNCSFYLKVGYGLIEETLTVQKDGVLLLTIYFSPRKKVRQKMYDSIFALAIVNVTEPQPPLTKKEWKHATIMKQSLPYYDDIKRRGLIFPTGGLQLEFLQKYCSYSDGIMENHNFGYVLYNNHFISNKEGVSLNISAYNYKDGRNNFIFTDYEGCFLFLRFQGDRRLYIKFTRNPDIYWYHSIKGKRIRARSYMFKYGGFSPLIGTGHITLDNVIDPNKMYFFETQIMRRELYKEKGFSAFQGCGEGEFDLFDDHGEKLIWGIFKNGKKKIINFTTWPYNSAKRRIDTFINKSKFYIVLNCTKNKVYPTTKYFSQTPLVTLKTKLEKETMKPEKETTKPEKETMKPEKETTKPEKETVKPEKEKIVWWFISKMKTVPSFILIKHEIYLPVIILVIITLSFLTIPILMLIQKCVLNKFKPANNAKPNVS